jgi:PAS domain S-box-containing protein
MNQMDLASVLRHINERVVELRSATHADDGAGTSLASQAVEELSTSLEELMVADEELRRQSAELSALNIRAESERRRYQDLFWTAPHGYLTTDVRGVILEANRAAGLMFEMAPVTMRGKPLALLVDTSDRAEFQAWLRSLVENDSGQAELELRCRNATRERTFRCCLSVSRLAPSGQPDAFRWAVADLSERDLARESLEIREESRRKDEFLAMLGHELRNPLAAIVMAAELLDGEQADLGTDRARWALGVIDRHAAHLGRLVDDLLDVSRLAHGKIALQVSGVDLDAVLLDAIDAVQPRAIAKGVELLAERPSDPVLVLCDSARMRQVFSNVLDNAVKYTPAGGHVRTSLSRDGERAVVSVGDDGAGMSPELLGRVFGLFEQGSGSGHPSDSGLGVGLALVHQLVQLHGGQVEARSAGPGKGSEIVIQLPLLASTSPDLEPPDEELEPLEHPLRVLVADDDPDLAEMLGIGISRLGHPVDVVHDGQEALERAVANRAELAILDLGMPGMSGLELARKLRDALPGIVLVALTGFGDEAHRSDARSATFDHYMVKPLELRSLRDLVRQVEQAHLDEDAIRGAQVRGADRS